MDQSGSTDNLLLALAGSSIFWSILAGMAVKTLRLDADRLEAFLKDAYGRASSFTFDARKFGEVAILTTLRSLYGNTTWRVIAATLIASTAMNAYIFDLLHRDWLENQKAIVSIERKAMQEVSPNYVQLMNSTAGLRKLDHALATKLVAGRAVAYVNDDAEARATRKIYDKYEDGIELYGQKNHVSYELNLAKLFGDGLGDRNWSGGDTFDLALLFGMMVVGTCAIDTLAFLCAIKLIKDLYKGDATEIFRHVTGLLALFVCSLLNYAAVFVGKEAAALKFSFIILIVGTILASFLVFVADSETGMAILVKSVLAVAFVVVLFYLRASSASISPTEQLTDIKLKMFLAVHGWLQILQNGANAKAVLMSTETIFPLICACAIFLLVYMGKALIMSGKEVFLWSVLGNSKIAGGTYFTGFLTTVIASTYLIIWLIHLLSSHLHFPHH